MRHQWAKWGTRLLGSQWHQKVKYWKSQKNSFLKDLFIVGFQPLGIKKINNKGFLKVENILVSVYDIILVVSMYFYAFSNILEYIMI